MHRYVHPQSGFAVNRVGALLVPFLTIYLQDALDLGVEFATRAIGIFGLYAIIILWSISETLPSLQRAAGLNPRGVPRGLKAAAPQPSCNAGDASVSQTIPLHQAIKRILLDRVFMIFCIASLLIAVVYMQYMSTFPLYLRQHGLGPETYGKLIALNGAMIVLFQLPVTTIVSRFRRGTVVALGAVVVAVGFGLIGFAVTVWQFALTIMIWTTGELMQAPLMQAIVSDLAPTELRGRYMGVFSMCFSGAIMIGSPVGGLVLARLGGAYVWGGCFSVALLAALLYLSVHKPIRAKRVEQAA